jgi:hypothetical protein
MYTTLLIVLALLALGVIARRYVYWFLLCLLAAFLFATNKNLDIEHD